MSYSWRPEIRSASELSSIPVATSSSGQGGPGPSPLRQSTSQQSVAFGPQGTSPLYYDLTTNNGTLSILPTPLQHCVCRRVFVEYLYDNKVGEPPTMKTGGVKQTPNHVVIKLDLGLNVYGYSGVHILMDVGPEVLSADFREGTFARGVLYMRFVTYAGQSWNSCRTLEVELKQETGQPLFTFMNPILDKNMQVFSFAARDGYYRGCRHWVTNVLLTWKSMNLITSRIKGTHPVAPPIQVDDIFGAIGYDYASPYHAVRDPSTPLLSGIIKGAFATPHEYDEQLVPYMGSRRYEVALQYVYREGLAARLGGI
ncbi:hypothetical protein DL771_007068 [Monosporascus sp. 5C6A]|nr:hypothetical protein DL771_007068 [Monosporascus sp. 5C6A]